MVADDFNSITQEAEGGATGNCELFVEPAPYTVSRKCNS